MVSALEDPNPEVAGAGHARLRAAGIAVEVGVGAAEARRDHAGHIRRMRDGRPHVTLKLAVSADGKAGAAGRKPIAITGEAVRERVHLMRAQSDAILIGIGTALADDPSLTCRLPGMAKNSPVRVVLDRALRLPPAGKLAQTARETPVWVIAAEGWQMLPSRPCGRPGSKFCAPQRAAVASISHAVLKLLAGRGITRLMVEGGPTVAASFVAADLVDEAVLFHSARIVGADGIDALEGLPLSALTGRLRHVGNEMVGADRMEVYERG